MRISYIRAKSLLLPDTRQTTVLPIISSLNYSRAPTDNAPAGSTNIPIKLKWFIKPYSLNISIIIVQTCPSGTRVISYRHWFRISNVLTPAFCIAAPSTKVLIFFNSSIYPCWIANFIEGELIWWFYDTLKVHNLPSLCVGSLT